MVLSTIHNTSINPNMTDEIILRFAFIVPSIVQHCRECIYAFRKEVWNGTDKSVPYGVDRNSTINWNLKSCLYSSLFNLQILLFVV